MLLGSMLAGMAFANAPVAAVHALAYPIGGDLPCAARAVQRAGAACTCCASTCPRREALYAELAADRRSRHAQGCRRGARAAFVDALAAICRDCKVPASLARGRHRPRAT